MDAWIGPAWIGSVAAGPWLLIVMFGAAIVTAVVPWVNAEVVMLAAIPLTRTDAELAGLVMAMTAGQMTGKSAMYWLARGASGAASARWRTLTAPVRDRLANSRRGAGALVLASAVAGMPPFYLVSIAAGGCRMAFGRFLAAGVCGRLVHFAAVAAIPHFVRTGL